MTYSSLRRTRGLSRTGPESKRRKALRPVSDRKRAERDAADPVVEAVYRRDYGCVLAGYRAAGACVGSLTPHHLMKQSAQRGGWTLDNIVAACVGHNTWVEDHPDEAHALGLVVRRGETTADAWDRMRAAGIIPPGRTP